MGGQVGVFLQQIAHGKVVNAQAAEDKRLHARLIGFEAAEDAALLKSYASAPIAAGARPPGKSSVCAPPVSTAKVVSVGC